MKGMLRIVGRRTRKFFSPCCDAELHVQCQNFYSSHGLGISKKRVRGNFLVYVHFSGQIWYVTFQKVFAFCVLNCYSNLSLFLDQHFICDIYYIIFDV